MVSRKLNRPIFKIKNDPVVWVRQILVGEWICSNCFAIQKKDSISVELTISKTRQDQKAVKRYLCLDCAITYGETVVNDSKLCKLHGAEGYRFIKGV